MSHLQRYGVTERVNVTSVDPPLDVQHVPIAAYIQGVPGVNANILGGHSIGHSKHKTLYALIIKSALFFSIESVPGGKVNILGGHSIGHSKQKTLYEHVSYSERFLR